MSGLEAFAVIGLVGVVAQLVSAFRDGDSILGGIRSRRAARHARPLPRQLEDSIVHTPEDLEREKNRGIDQFGQKYRDGDQEVIMMLQHVTIQMQGSLLVRLRNALDDETDFTILADDVCSARMLAMKALLDFQHRLLMADSGSNTAWLSAGQGGGLGISPSQEPSIARIMPPARSTARPPIEPDSYPRHDSFTESPPQPARQHTFGLFGRNRRSSRTRNNPQETTEVDSLEFRRVVTLPPDAVSDSATIGQPEPSNRSVATPPSPQPRTRQANNQPAPPAPSATPSRTQANASIRQPTGSRTLSNEHEPWLNEHEVWGQQDMRTPRGSVAVPTQPRSGIPQAMQNTRAFSVSLPGRTRTAQSGSSSSSGGRLYPNKSNDYLGFCKGACKMQDRGKETMKEAKDWTQTSVSSLKFLECADCKYQGHYDLKTIWTMIAISGDHMKIRWSFLAKSHVRQTELLRRSEAKKDMFSYQCIFCVFTGSSQAVFQGAEKLMKHIEWHHHGQDLDDVVLYKAGCVNDRTCANDEEFDINIYPRIESVDD